MLIVRHVWDVLRAVPDLPERGESGQERVPVHAAGLHLPLRPHHAAQAGGQGEIQHRGGLLLVLQKVASELHPKVRNYGEGPY